MFDKRERYFMRKFVISFFFFWLFLHYMLLQNSLRIPSNHHRELKLIFLFDIFCWIFSNYSTQIKPRLTSENDSIGKMTSMQTNPVLFYFVFCSFSIHDFTFAWIRHIFWSHQLYNSIRIHTYICAIKLKVKVKAPVLYITVIYVFKKF